MICQVNSKYQDKFNLIAFLFPSNKKLNNLPYSTKIYGRKSLKSEF